MAQLLMPGSVVAMTDQAADRLLKLDSGDAALLYLHLLRRGTPDGLRWPEDRKQRALDQLKEHGLAPAALAAATISCRSRRSPAPRVWGGGHHRRPQRPCLHLPSPGRRGGAAAGQKAHGQ